MLHKKTMLLLGMLLGLMVLSPSHSLAVSETETNVVKSQESEQYRQILADRDQALRDVYVKWTGYPYIAARYDYAEAY